MSLTNRTPSTQPSGEDRRCWLERTTPEQRKTVAGYERESFTPVKCVGHFDHKNRLWLGLERWIDYPDGRRDTQNITLLVKNDGAILQSILHPIERSNGDDVPDQPALPIAPAPDDSQALVTSCHERSSNPAPDDLPGVMALEPEPAKQKTA